LEKKHFVTISLQEDPDSRIVGGKKDYEEGLQEFGGFHLFGDMAISALRITNCAVTDLLARYTYLILI